MGYHRSFAITGDHPGHIFLMNPDEWFDSDHDFVENCRENPFFKFAC